MHCAQPLLRECLSVSGIIAIVHDALMIPVLLALNIGRIPFSLQRKFSKAKGGSGHRTDLLESLPE